MIYIIILLALAAIDLLVKNHIEYYYIKGQEKKVCKNFITITRSHNKGAFLNFMEKKELFVKVSSVVVYTICFIALIYLIIKKQCPVKKLALAFILGGALSNEYDRLKKGSVTDYISFNLPFINKVVFNLGDFAIFAGAIILILDELDT